ncbi:PTS transporter subunit EIIB [Ligilactobacillus apodemi]|nr:PTS transporter subunit EIIB [Ligilactobacillus apodemi]MCR1901686.1 PTS transporter subunit EIIB [Ligilactobacillus apodemi]
MAGKYDATASKIMTLVGGTENVSSLIHCVTRLRFVLKDTTKADREKLAQTEYVLTVLDSGGATSSRSW